MSDDVERTPRSRPSKAEPSWYDQVPCDECGGRPGYNPATGVENKQGHRLGCSQWKQE
jgi:hypothetical protein